MRNNQAIYNRISLIQSISVIFNHIKKKKELKILLKQFISFVENLIRVQP